ncbi:MAG: VOC family protein [Pseudomonadota bacterium]
MKVKRIVADLQAGNPREVARFYEEVLGLRVLMDLGWIATVGSAESMPIQLSLASEGGSETAMPNLSVEVDDLDEALTRARSFGASIEYGPTTEPWGVRRFYVRDPAGSLINILQHT